MPSNYSIHEGDDRNFFLLDRNRHEVTPYWDFDIDTEIAISDMLDSDWKKNQIYLRGIGIDINIHENVEFRDNGYDFCFDTVTPNGIMGECRFIFNHYKDIFQAEIVRAYGLDNLQSEFTRGHEEAHAMECLGLLSDLINRAKNMDLNFDFYAEINPDVSDKCAKKILSYDCTDEDYKIAWGKDHLLCESIANVGGLIALINLGADSNLISSVREGIIKNEKNPFPYITKIRN